MDTASILAFNIAILGALISPGPAFLALVRSALTGGRAEGFTCALGLATGSLIWCVLAVLGLTAVFALVPWAYLALKLLGAAYLIWFAVNLWRHAAAPLPLTKTQTLSGFQKGLVVNLANPKAVFFIAAIFATVFPVMPTGADAALILANHFVLESVFYSACTLALGTTKVRAAYLKTKAWFDRMAAVVLGAMAIRIAT